MPSSHWTNFCSTPSRTESFNSDINASFSATVSSPFSDIGSERSTAGEIPQQFPSTPLSGPSGRKTSVADIDMSYDLTHEPAHFSGEERKEARSIPSVQRFDRPAAPSIGTYSVGRASSPPSAPAHDGPTVIFSPVAPGAPTWVEPAYPPSMCTGPVPAPLRQVDFLYTADEHGKQRKYGFAWRVEVSPEQQASYLRIKVLQTAGFRDLYRTLRDKARREAEAEQEEEDEAESEWPEEKEDEDEYEEWEVAEQLRVDAFGDADEDYEPMDIDIDSDYAF